MKMTAGEASLLAKLEKIEHNQNKIMEAILVNDNDFTIQNIWIIMDEQEKQIKKDKQQAKKEGYTYSAWLKKEGK